jgi:hypothetical protein
MVDFPWPISPLSLWQNCTGPRIYKILVPAQVKTGEVSSWGANIKWQEVPWPLLSLMWCFQFVLYFNFNVIFWSNKIYYDVTFCLMVCVVIIIVLRYKIVCCQISHNLQMHGQYSSGSRTRRRNHTPFSMQRASIYLHVMSCGRTRSINSRIAISFVCPLVGACLQALGISSLCLSDIAPPMYSKWSYIQA